jgi:hypothetical protein
MSQPISVKDVKKYKNEVESKHEVTYNLEDMVLLSTKILPRFVGPFSVMEQINPVAFKINLPAGLRIMHNAFHISLFRHILKGKVQDHLRFQRL